MKRLLKRLAIGLAGLVAAVALAVAAVLFTAAGREAAARLALDFAASAGMPVTITTIDWPSPGTLTVAGVTVADPEGEWLAVDRATLAWRPAALFDWTLAVDRLDVGTVAVRREPAYPPSPSDGSATFRLPIAVDVAEARVERLELAEAVAGEAADIAATGSLRIPLSADREIVADLSADVTGGPAAKVDLAVAFRPEEMTLTAKLAATAAPGGIVHALARLPDDRPLSLTYAGEGPLADWTGTLSASLGDAPLVRGTTRIGRAGDGYRLETGLYATIAALLPSDLAPLVGDAAEIALVARRSDAGDVTVDSASATVAAGRVAVSGSLAADGALAATIEGSLAGSEVFRGLVGDDVAWRAGSLAGSLGGTLARPSAQVTLALDAPVAATLAAERAELSATADPVEAGFLGLGEAGHRVAVTMRLTAATIDGRPLPAGEVPALSAGLAVAADGDVDLKTARLDAFGGTVTASGNADDTAVAMSADVTVPDLGPLGGFFGRTLAGSVKLAATVEGSPAETRFAARFDGSAAGLATGEPLLDAAAGASPRISGAVAFADDRLTVDALTLTGGVVSGEASGTVAKGAAGLDVTVRASDVGAFAPTVSGPVEITAHVTGDPQAPVASFRLSSTALVAAGQTLRPFAATGSVDLSQAGLRRAEVELTGASAGQPIAGRIRVEDGDGRRSLAVDGLRFVGLSASGTLAQAGGAAPTGRLTIDATDVAAVAALAGVAASGGFTAAVDMPAATPGTVRLDLTSRRLVAEGATVSGLNLRLSVADALGTPRIDAEATASTVAAQGATVEALRARATGPLAQLAVTADGRLNGLATSLAGSVAQTTRGVDVRLDRGSVGTGAQSIRLTRPGTARLAGADASLDLALATGAGGNVTLSGRAGAQALAIEARLDGLPLALARLAAPDLDLAGTVSGRASVSGSPRAPRGTYDLAFRGVRDLAAPAKVPAAEATVRGSLADGRATMTAAITVGPEVRLDLSGSVPVGAGSLDLGVRGTVGLDLVQDMALPPTTDLGGRAVIDARVRGTVAAPLASGTVRFEGLSYNDVVNDIRLEGVSGTIRLDGRVARLDALAANIATGGRLELGGTVTLDPAAGFPGDISIAAKRANVQQEGLATGIVDADLGLSGPLARAPAIRGSVVLDRVEITIPDRLPASSSTIEVRHRNVPERLRDHFPDPADPDQKPPVPFVATLDVQVRAANQILVRGQGINAEFAGDFRVSGNTDTPLVTGGLTMRRGTFDIIGQRLDFSRGRIRFYDDLDPELDMQADTTVSSVTASVLVTGRGSDPRISFTSSPEMPQDEILSYILFRKATTSLSAGEAVALAQAIDRLAGTRAFGMLDTLRSRLGVDRLGLTSDRKNNAALELGGYATDNVYVGVKQGTSGSSTRMTVTVDVTDSVNVGAEVGADGDQRVGVGVEWDY